MQLKRVLSCPRLTLTLVSLGLGCLNHAARTSKGRIPLFAPNFMLLTRFFGRSLRLPARNRAVPQALLCAGFTHDASTHHCVCVFVSVAVCVRVRLFIFLLCPCVRARVRHPLHFIPFTLTSLRTPSPSPLSAALRALRSRAKTRGRRQRRCRSSETHAPRGSSRSIVIM